MKQVILICAMIVALAFPMQAQDGPAAGVRAAISKQIKAFRERDVDTAFSYASPSIQRLFQSPERFGDMVQSGYPMVWSSTKVDFLDLRQEGGLVWQKVLLRDAAGRNHVIDYKMVSFGDDWRIDGVMFLRQAGQDV